MKDASRVDDVASPVVAPAFMLLGSAAAAAAIQCEVFAKCGIAAQGPNGKPELLLRFDGPVAQSARRALQLVPRGLCKTGLPLRLASMRNALSSNRSRFLRKRAPRNLLVAKGSAAGAWALQRRRHFATESGRFHRATLFDFRAAGISPEDAGRRAPRRCPLRLRPRRPLGAHRLRAPGTLHEGGGARRPSLARPPGRRPRGAQVLVETWRS